MQADLAQTTSIFAGTGMFAGLTNHRTEDADDEYAAKGPPDPVREENALSDAIICLFQRR